MITSTFATGSAIGKGIGPDLCRLDNDEIALVYGSQTGPGTAGCCVFEVRNAGLSRIHGPVVLPVSETVNCAPRVQVIGGVVFVAYMVAGPDRGLVWRDDTEATTLLGPVGGMRPFAWGPTAVYRVDQAQPSRGVWKHDAPSFASPTLAANRQTSQGLARIAADGRTIIFAEDPSLHGLWSSAVCQVGDLTVLDNGDDGLVVSIGPETRTLQVLPGQAAHDPRAVRLSDGSYVIATSGVPDGIRLVRVARTDIANQLPPTVPEFGHPLVVGSAGVYWTGGMERAPGTWTVIDAAYPELQTALQHYASIVIDGYDASIAGAASSWGRVRAVAVFCETSKAALQSQVDAAVASMQAHQLPRRPVIAYRGRHDDWHVTTDHPEGVWYGLEIYPDPKEGRDQVERRIARARASLPPGAPIVAFCQTYDRRGSYTNLGRLATLHRVYAETVASLGAQGRGVVFWHYSDEGSSCGAHTLADLEPGLLLWQQAIVRAAGVAPPIVTIPGEGGPPVAPTFENKYSDLVEVAQSSPNWRDAIDPTLSEGQRLDACMAFINECAFVWNDEDDVAAGTPGSYGKLWRQSKNSYSDDCMALIGSDGKLYESDCIKNAGGTDAVLQWMTPSASKWAYHAPTDPGDESISEPGPEPEPPPTGEDDMQHFAINEDLTSRALDELDALNKKHWLVDRAPNPSISRYIFGVYEPNMQKELNAIGHLPGDPATWEAIHDQSVELFTQQLYADHHGAVVPGEPVPPPDPQ